MIKVVIISELSGGGVEKVNTTIAEHIDTKIFDVTVLSMVTNHKQWENVKLPFNCIFLEEKSKKHALISTVKALKKLQPDIILTCGFVEAYFALLYKKLYARKSHVIYALHSVYSHLDKSTPKKKFLCNILPRLLRLFKKIDAIIFVSNGVKEDFEVNVGIFKSKEYIIYNPIVDENKTNFRYKELKTEQIKLITAGRIEQEKNQQLMIDVIKQFTDYGLNAHLTILGKGSLEKKLQQRCEELGIQHKFTFMGFRKNMTEEMANGDIFLLTSKYESFSNVIVEAMNTGLPVVTMDCPCGPREILNHGEFGTLVPMNDVEAMCAAILCTIKNNSEIKVQRAYLRSLDFTIRKSVNGYECLFNKLEEK